MIDSIPAKKELLMRKIALDLWGDITLRTPVDTGRARANWFLTVGAPSNERDLHEGAKTGEVAAPPTPSLNEITGNESIFIINNLVYIEALEEGHSKQAPIGMVRLALQAEAALLQGTALELEK